MQTLTRALAEVQPTVREVRLSPTLTAYVRRLNGDSLETFVEALQKAPTARAVHLTALCACNPDGVPLFPQADAGAQAEVATWPPIWVMKLADEAGSVNGLDTEVADDPNVDAGADSPPLRSASG